MTSHDLWLQEGYDRARDEEIALTDVLDDPAAMESIYVSVASEWSTVSALIGALDLGHIDAKAITERVLALARIEAGRRKKPEPEDFDDIVSPETAAHFNRVIRAKNAA